MIALVSRVYTDYFFGAGSSRSHSLRIFFSSLAGSDFRCFHMPRLFSHTDNRSCGVIKGYSEAFFRLVFIGMARIVIL